jgi:hypothetical protein
MVHMETIIFKVPAGTRAKLRRIHPNISALLREQIENLTASARPGSAHEKAGDLCGSLRGGPKNASTSAEYLQQYAPKSAR